MFFSLLSLGRFYGIDSLIELLIIIVAGVIALYSHKIYKILDDKHYRFFSWAFVFIAISFVFKILSNFTILNRVKIQGANFVYTIVTQPSYMPIIDFVSFTLYKCFYLIGLLILFLLLTKTDSREKVFLFVYLSIVAILFSIYFNFVFHLTIVLLLIFLAMHFYDNYKSRRTSNALLVFIAFLIILISHLFMVFSDIGSLFYMIAEGLMLIGFMCLLINQIKIKFVYKNGKKKQAGSDKGYLRNIAKK